MVTFDHGPAKRKRKPVKITNMDKGSSARQSEETSAGKPAPGREQE